MERGGCAANAASGAGAMNLPSTRAVHVTTWSFGSRVSAGAFKHTHTQRLMSFLRKRESAAVPENEEVELLDEKGTRFAAF